MAPHPHVEGAQRMGDEQAVQIQPVWAFCAAAGDGDGFREVGQLEWGMGSERRTGVLPCSGLMGVQDPRPLMPLGACCA